MGQAKQRGTFEQRRQGAVAKKVPTNQTYKPSRRVMDERLKLLVAAAITGIPLSD